MFFTMLNLGYTCREAEKDIETLFSERPVGEGERGEAAKRLYHHAVLGKNNGSYCGKCLHLFMEVFRKFYYRAALKEKIRRVYCMRCWMNIEEKKSSVDR